MVPQVKNVTTQQIIANRCFTITTAVLTNQKQAPELCWNYKYRQMNIYTLYCQKYWVAPY